MVKRAGERFRLHRLVGSLLVLGVIAGILPVAEGLELRVTPVTGDVPLLVLPLEAAECFTVHYYHSVENAPIWEMHCVDEAGQIYIEEERYLKFGAGMGKMPGVGRMTQRGPYEVIENMHMPTGDFILRIGSPGVDHTVIWRGTRNNLSAMAPHQAVRFSVAAVPWTVRCWRAVFPHRATPTAGKPFAGNGAAQSISAS